MPTKFLNLSTDTTLGGATPSDELAVSQKAIKAYTDTKAPLDTFLAPNFDGLTPIATYEFDTSSTSFYKLLTFNNIYATTEAIPVAHALFRITATVGGKTSVINAIVETQKALGYMRILSNHTTGYTASSNTGLRYIRSSTPKVLNDGNDWELDVGTYNATARHIKVEVFQSDEGFTWFANGSVSTITTNTHTSTNITYYTTQGTITHPSLNMTVASATSATYISSRLPKILSGTMPLTGAALLANQFCFMSNSLVYPATENTVPINTGFGLAVSYGAVASGGGTTSYQILQKYPVSSLSNIPHDTLERGAPCFFRCTMDANGNIFSDNYVATEMTAGYTWYYVGVASSATAIMVDTTSSVFLTLDANGNLTHVNGKSLAGGGGGGAVDSVNGKTGVVVLDASDVGAATAAQGALADTALQSGNNVSELVNDAGYLVMGDLTGFVTRTTAQTISGLKTFTADIVLSGTTSIKNTTSGVSYTMLYRDTSGIHVGTSTQALLLAGSGTRPTFNGNNVAMSADIPTVNNPTITFTQGGVTKGSFSLNQSGDTTIALNDGSGFAPDIFDYKWRDATTSNAVWALSDGNWKTNATALAHLTSDYNNIPLVSTICAEFTGSGDVNGRYYRTPQFDVSGATYEYAYVRQNTDGTITIRYANVSDGGTTLTLYWPHPEQEAGDVGYTPHNVDAWSIKTPHYDVIDGATIVYYTAADGHKICLANQETNLNAIYATTGVAWYYLLDTANQRFKLPRKTSMQIVRSVQNNDGSWYNLYANGRVEQGGRAAGPVANSNAFTISLPVEMANAKYTVTFCGTTRSTVLTADARYTTYFQFFYSNNLQNVNGYDFSWEVRGMSALDMTNEKNGQKYLYFYVGA